MQESHGWKWKNRYPEKGKKIRHMDEIEYANMLLYNIYMHMKRKGR